MTINRKEIYKSLKMYLWMAPAFLLIFLFMLKPSFETIYLSLFEKIKFSEQEFTTEIIEALSASTGRVVKTGEKFKSFAEWDKMVKKIEDKYQVKINRDSISETLTIKETIEFFTMNIYEKLEKRGGLKKFVGLKNYLTMFSDRYMLIAFRNNLLWLLLFTFFTITFGLIMATIIDKVSWSNLAKTIFFLPMAISYVASGVIWAFMYAKDVNTGTINAIINFFNKLFSFISGNGFESAYTGIAFLGRAETVNFVLIAAAIWMWTGYCIIIFTAALNSISDEIIEAAKIDGANFFRIFFNIQIPVIFPTITVVTTIMIINVLKVFDIVYTMTRGGPYGASEVIANRMYRTAFNEGNFEYAAAMAVILFIAIIPIMALNIRTFIFEEKTRA